MKRLAPIVLAAAAVLAACAYDADTAAIVERVKSTTDPSGWRVDCSDDHHTATRRCFAGTFARGLTADSNGPPFQVIYYNQSGPYLLTGFHTDPTTQATVRVDSGTVHTIDNADAYRSKHVAHARRVVADLKKGRIAYVTYWPWPQGRRQMEVDLAGFDKAHAALIAKVKAPRNGK